jgi:hypothetical protein
MERISLTMKSVHEALELHLRELNDLFILPPLEQEPKLSPQVRKDQLEDERRLQAALRSAFTDAAARSARRGRPPASHSSSERTHQSFQAFFFVCGEMAIFEKRNGAKRTPERVKDAFIDFARKLYPSARTKTVREHIRRYRRYLPKVEGPKCLLLVRSEFLPRRRQGLEAKSIFVNVLVAFSRAGCPS